jgi:hypothetical protein
MHTVPPFAVWKQVEVEVEYEKLHILACYYQFPSWLRSFHISWKVEVHYHVDKILPLDPNLSQLNSVHTDKTQVEITDNKLKKLIYILFIKEILLSDTFINKVAYL